MKRIYIFLILSLLVCNDSMEKSSGYVKKIVVVSSHKQVEMLIDFVNMFSYTPQREYFFEYDCIKPDNIMYYKRYHTLVIVGTLKDSIIHAFTTQEQREKINSEGYLLTRLKDPWVQDQVVFVIGTKEEEDIRPAILANKFILMKEFYKRIVLRMGNVVYEMGREHEVEKRIKEVTGINVKIPVGFKLLKDTFDFIAIKKHQPDRFLFFSKIKRNNRDIVAVRDSLTSIYYEGDYVERRYLRIDSIEKDGIKGAKITGIWQNDRDIAGGPFTTYVFTVNDSLLILDGGIYAPEKRKLPYVLQIEAILRSVYFEKER